MFGTRPLLPTAENLSRHDRVSQQLPLTECKVWCECGCWRKGRYFMRRDWHNCLLFSGESFLIQMSFLPCLMSLPRPDCVHLFPMTLCIDSLCLHFASLSAAKVFRVMSRHVSCRSGVFALSSSFWLRPFELFPRFKWFSVFCFFPLLSHLFVCTFTTLCVLSFFSLKLVFSFHFHFFCCCKFENKSPLVWNFVFLKSYFWFQFWSSPATAILWKAGSSIRYGSYLILTITQLLPDCVIWCDTWERDAAE